MIFKKIILPNNEKYSLKNKKEILRKVRKYFSAGITSEISSKHSSEANIKELSKQVRN